MKKKGIKGIKPIRSYYDGRVIGYLDYIDYELQASNSNRQ